MSPRKHFDCAVIGDWHLAFCTATCLAKTGKRVALVNPLLPGQKEWREFPSMPVREPGLTEMIAESRSAGLLSHLNGITADWSADVVWMAIDTPVNENDEPDTSTLEAVAQAVVRNGNAKGPFVISSQIPVGFSLKLEHDLGLAVAYVPENLRLGRGIETFMNADRTVVGASRPETREQVLALLSGFRTEFLTCDLVTAEMTKHATNAFLATSISFANELARIGELYGADNQVVARSLKMDKRIGPQAYVAPGLGFAGGTLPRDLRVLQKIGKQKQIPTPLVDAVLTVNESTAAALLGAVRQYLGELKGKRVLLVGYTYKAETDTLRRSSSLELAQELTRHQAEVYGFDPVMNEKDLAPLSGIIRHCPSLKEVDRRPDAVLIMTPRPEFVEIDWAALLDKPASTATRNVPLLLDTRALLAADRVKQAGFAYKALWQPVQLP